MNKDLCNLVSVIMPTYNSSEFVLETIRSIQSQTYSNWEVLITDDDSADNTVELIQGLVAKDSRIKLIQLSDNRGAGIARNHSIEKASGGYIAFLDSDDLWDQGYSSAQLPPEIIICEWIAHTSFGFRQNFEDLLGQKEIVASRDFQIQWRACHNRHALTYLLQKRCVVGDRFADTSRIRLG